MSSADGLLVVNCHSEPFASCHSEEAKRPKNRAQDRLREGSVRDAFPMGLKMTEGEVRWPTAVFLGLPRM
jgi:hypothetical protein